MVSAVLTRWRYGGETSRSGLKIADICSDHNIPLGGSLRGKEQAIFLINAKTDWFSQCVSYVRHNIDLKPVHTDER
jgi:hypothetical protein